MHDDSYRRVYGLFPSGATGALISSSDQHHYFSRHPTFTERDPERPRSEIYDVFLEGRGRSHRRQIRKATAGRLLRVDAYVLRVHHLETSIG